MPQLDRIIIFPQIFWLFVIFTLFYTVLTHFFLPKFLKSIKARKQIVDFNSKEVLIVNTKFHEQQILMKKIIVKNLTLIEKLMKNEISFSNLNESNSNIQLADEQLAKISLNNSLYCDINLLNSITLFPKSLNLRFKNN